jgi:hypothetical protein
VDGEGAAFLPRRKGLAPWRPHLRCGLAISTGLLPRAPARRYGGAVFKLARKSGGGWAWFVVIDEYALAGSGEVASTPVAPRLRNPHARSQCSASNCGYISRAREAVDRPDLTRVSVGAYDADLPGGAPPREVKHETQNLDTRTADCRGGTNSTLIVQLCCQQTECRNQRLR